MSKYMINTWEPESPTFWGKRRQAAPPTATCGFRFPRWLLAFAVWMVWSVVVVNLPATSASSTAPTSCSG
jgi:NNP family nitrate/nitrite transporter-like MFS transporter